MPLEQADLDQITTLINNSINGAVSRLVKTDIPKLIETAAPKPAEPQQQHQPDPEVAALKRQVADLTAANERTAAENNAAKRTSALDRALSTFSFANEDSRATAFASFNSQIVESQDGNYFIGDQPLDAAVKAKMTNLSGLLAPKPVQGSGASGGHSTDSAITEEMIKPGMKADDAAKVGAHLASFLTAA